MARVAPRYTFLFQLRSRPFQFARELGSRGSIGSVEFLADLSPLKSCVTKLRHLTASLAQLASGFLGIQSTVFLGRDRIESEVALKPRLGRALVRYDAA